MAFAAVGRSMRPVSIAVMASIGPASWIDRTVPLRPGKMPSFTSGKPSRVPSSRSAMR